MVHLLRDSLSHALVITGFVFVMMLVVEYLQVLSRGLWERGLRGSRWRQYLLAALLGALPGCLGAFAVAALRAHGVVSLGALVACMVATSGDEAFVMLAMMPQRALGIFALLFALGIAAGLATDAIFDAGRSSNSNCATGLGVHEEELCHCYPRGRIVEQLGHCTLARGTLLVFLVLFLFGVLSGQLGPPTWNWVKVSLLLAAGLGLFIVSTVPDHFLEEHLWQHVAKVHLPRVFLCTLGALTAMRVLVDHLHLEGWLHENQLVVLLIACLVGLIPESGPHLVFVTLYVSGAVPLSVLVASSVVQDGHGMLPVLAESRRDFVRVKAVNLGAGLVVGLVGYRVGW